MPKPPTKRTNRIDLESVLDVEVLREQILGDWQEAIVARRDELLAGFARFTTEHPKIEDDDTQAKAGVFARQLSVHLGMIDNQCQQTKAPILAASRLLDSLKHEMADGLTAAKTQVEARQTVYARAVAAAAAQKARDEAAKAKVEADRLAAEAEARIAAAGPAAATQAIEDAVVAEDAASTATHAADNVDRAAATRVRTFGATVSLAGKWTHEVTDLMELVKSVAAGKTSIEALTVSTRWLDYKLANEMGIKKDGTQPVPGVRFYKEEKISNR